MKFLDRFMLIWLLWKLKFEWKQVRCIEVLKKVFMQIKPCIIYFLMHLPALHDRRGWVKEDQGQIPKVLLNIFLIGLSLAGFQMGLKLLWKFWSFNCTFSRIECVKLSFNRSIFINLTHLLKKNMLTKCSICSTYWHANRMLMYIARHRLKVILLHDL